jgi:hypothetical protein
MKRNSFLKHIISVISVIIFVFIAFGSSDSDDSSSSDYSSEDLLAYIYAEDYVKQRLRSPSTAKFPGVWDGKADHISKVGEREYFIRSYVDSQNGFGAMIRTNWSCKMIFVGERAKCEDLRLY